jgi:hypothetical protein
MFPKILCRNYGSQHTLIHTQRISRAKPSSAFSVCHVDNGGRLTLMLLLKVSGISQQMSSAQPKINKNLNKKEKVRNTEDNLFKKHRKEYLPTHL